MVMRSFLRITAAALIAVFVSGAIWSAFGQSLFDRLVKPGDLIEGHAKYEKDCNNCHEPFSKSSQTKLCIDCHKDIAADRREKRGFHGMRPDTVNVDCKHCHTDHKGRNANVVPFDRETFNHKFTDFELKGAHKSARCEGCHDPKQKYRKAPGKCFDCHKKIEPHKTRLGEKCEDCHTEDNWRKVKPYDHSKTKFPLKGAHEKVACSACHAGEKYKDIPKTCAECHQLQDVHRGRHGNKCEKCHESTKWKTVKFDHGKETKFTLRGHHAKAKCESCHLGDPYKDKLSMECVSCHKKNDVHKGQLGTQCQKCHNETDWRQKVAFDHDLTHFPLVGLHSVVPCEECHKSQSFTDTPRICVGCHKDTHHEGRLGTACANCHNPNGWKLWRFDHDKQTKFPLTGKHKGMACQLCHREKNVAKISLPKGCYGCHSQDDAHQGNFGAACDKCHTTTSWSALGSP